MTEPAKVVDLLIIGAGPAGTAAAVTAARAGLRVLLADDFAAESIGGVLVSGVAMRRLAELGASVDGVRSADAVELRFPGESRQITGTGAAIADAGALRAALTNAAIGAGAELVNSRVTLLPKADNEDWAILNGVPVRASHVVLATGATGTTMPMHATGISCAQRFANIDIANRIVLAPLQPAAEPGAQPAMLTMLPGTDGTATVWLARREATESTPTETDPTLLLQDALATMSIHDRRCAAAIPMGAAVQAAIHSGFSQDLLEASEALLVGDAAGLANPFTGEGIGAALLSGALAGQAVAAHIADTDGARAQYVRRLAGEYVGYFETARHATRRYHLVWRTLNAAAASDHTIFAKARRAILLPEEIPGLAGDRVPITSDDRVVTGPFLVACDEVAVACLRTQWPFLARLLLSGTGPTRHRIRPALLFLAGLLAEGRPPDTTRAATAAAVELATFGALAFLGTESVQTAARSVDWAGATLVMAGDFLMSRASLLVAESAPEASWALADWLAELAASRAARLGDRPSQAIDLQASLMEFPARLGALLSGSSDDTVKTLRAVGGLLGEAFTHAEDILALTGRRSRLDMTLQASLAFRSSAIPDLSELHPDEATGLTADPAFVARALTASERACSTTLTRIHNAITDIPGPLARRILTAYAKAIAPDAMEPRGTPMP